MKDRIIEDWYGKKKSTKNTMPKPHKPDDNKKDHEIYEKHKQDTPIVSDPGFYIPPNSIGIPNNSAVNTAKILADIYFRGKKSRPTPNYPISHPGDGRIEHLPRALPDEVHIEKLPDNTRRGQSIPVQYANTRSNDPSTTQYQNTSGYGMVDPALLQAQQAQHKINTGFADPGLLQAQQAQQKINTGFADPGLLQAQQAQQKINTGFADPGLLQAQQAQKKTSTGFADPGLLQAQQAQQKISTGFADPGLLLAQQAQKKTSTGFADPGLLQAQQASEIIKLAPYLSLKGQPSTTQPAKEEELPGQKSIDWKAKYDEINRTIEILMQYSGSWDANGGITDYTPMINTLTALRDNIKERILSLVDLDDKGYNVNWDPSVAPLADSLSKESKTGEKILDGLQFTLDVIGLIPGAGELADGANALISLLRGNYVDAALSAGSMIPFAGWGSTAAKFTKKAVKAADTLGTAARDADVVFDAGEAIVKNADELADAGESAYKVLDDQITDNWNNPNALDLDGGAPKIEGSVDLSGPVEITPPSNATSEQIAQTKAYIDGSNQALQAGKLSPTGRVSTAGSLRTRANTSAARERARAIAAGTPYQGHVGHVPDTTWTGTADPFSWLDLDPSVNMSIGGQANRYPIGYKPTEFRFRDR